MELVEYRYNVNIVNTDGLVLKHQAISIHNVDIIISSHNVEYTPMCFQLFMS